MKKLTEKQQRFIAAYGGNAIEAARVAGYSEKSLVQNTRNLMRNPIIREAIRKREVKALHPLIQSQEKRLLYLVSIITSESKKVKTKDRLKAYELLARTRGDFLEPNPGKLQGSGSQAPPTIIVIKAGKESPVQVNINQAGEELPGNGEALPVAETVSGDNWPEG